MVKMNEMIEEIIQRGDRCNEELKILQGEIKEMKNALCKASNPKAGSVEEQTIVCEIIILSVQAIFLTTIAI